MSLDRFLIKLAKNQTLSLAFIGSANAVDIFMPSGDAIVTLQDADKYFFECVRRHAAGNPYLPEIEKALSRYEKGGDYSDEGYNDAMGEYVYEYDVAYLCKFAELPFEYVCSSFSLPITKFGDDPLTDFFSLFDDLFGDVNYVFDWEQISSWYEANKPG
jgi:hypothetical protein